MPLPKAPVILYVVSLLFVSVRSSSAVELASFQEPVVRLREDDNQAEGTWSVTENVHKKPDHDKLPAEADRKSLARVVLRGGEMFEIDRKEPLFA